MPPQSKSDVGWKFFFALIGVVQALGIGILWRTYDAITDLRKETLITKMQVEMIVTPKMQQHEARLSNLERKP